MCILCLIVKNNNDKKNYPFYLIPLSILFYLLTKKRYFLREDVRFLQELTYQGNLMHDRSDGELK